MSDNDLLLTFFGVDVQVKYGLLSLTIRFTNEVLKSLTLEKIMKKCVFNVNLLANQPQKNLVKLLFTLND